LATFTTLSASKLGICEIKHAHFGLAARFADHADTGLRGGDALHLAVCSDHGARMFTLDKRLYQAAKILGVPSEML
jgi:predicted nucleic acid-binding protein